MLKFQPFSALSIFFQSRFLLSSPRFLLRIIQITDPPSSVVCLYRLCLRRRVADGLPARHPHRRARRERLHPGSRYVFSLFPTPFIRDPVSLHTTAYCAFSPPPFLHSGPLVLRYLTHDFPFTGSSSTDDSDTLSGNASSTSTPNNTPQKKAKAS